MDRLFYSSAEWISPTVEQLYELCLELNLNLLLDFIVLLMFQTVAWYNTVPCANYVVFEWCLISIFEKYIYYIVRHICSCFTFCEFE